MQRKDTALTQLQHFWIDYAKSVHEACFGALGVLQDNWDAMPTCWQLGCTFELTCRTCPAPLFSVMAFSQRRQAATCSTSGRSGCRAQRLPENKGCQNAQHTTWE
jgi:hypothetical protein